MCCERAITFIPVFPWRVTYTTCSILVFQHTLDEFFCRIIQIYSKTLKLEENNKKQKITTETCDGRHICSCYNCEVLGKRQNKTYVGRGSLTFVCRDPSNHRSTDPAIHRTSQPTIYRTSTHKSNLQTNEPTIYHTFPTFIEPTNHRSSELSSQRSINRRSECVRRSNK